MVMDLSVLPRACLYSVQMHICENLKETTLDYFKFLAIGHNIFKQHTCSREYLNKFSNIQQKNEQFYIHLKLERYFQNGSYFLGLPMFA